LLLADSSLPLGSFAYSSGLESYIAHHKPLPPSTTPIDSFHKFLKISVASIARTSVPYLRHAYCHPEQLETLDNDLDASTPCTVARRASIAQGRALLCVWERSFKKACSQDNATADGNGFNAVHALTGFMEALESTDGVVDDIGANGHIAPLWGVICCAMNLDLFEAAYLFLLNHAKAVLSAAVRASVIGPYQAQSVLASDNLRSLLMTRLQKVWETKPEDAGQVAPALDLWVGRHELLYSRIFNS
jgi:urease accessory protein